MQLKVIHFKLFRNQETNLKLIIKYIFTYLKVKVYENSIKHRHHSDLINLKL